MKTINPSPHVMYHLYQLAEHNDEVILIDRVTKPLGVRAHFREKRPDWSNMWQINIDNRSQLTYKLDLL